jgi:hypothetical protein
MPQPLPVLERRKADNIFFTTTAVMMLVIVVSGFAPSYFLKGAVFAHLPSVLVHLHGAVFSSWIFLYVIQTGLISAKNFKLHRRLGLLGAVIAGLMVILGILAPIGTLRRHAVLPSFFTPADFLIGNMFGIILFGMYVAFAIWKRKDARVHKRVMYMANCMLLSPAISRFYFFWPWMRTHMYLVGVIPLGLVMLLLIYDLYSWRRPLLVTLIGGFLFWAADPVSDMLIKTPAAQRLTVWAQNSPGK